METIQTSILDPLKPLLLPITTNLPTPLNNMLISLLSEPCHSALLLDLSLTQSPECVSLAISKLLGVAIIAGASVVKIPQLVKLASSQSAAGLSYPSYMLETTSFLITMSYNIRMGNPFSTYGETSLILMQDVLITLLLCYFTDRQGLAIASLFMLTASTFWMLAPDSPISLSQMVSLQAVAGVLGVASKVPQIYANYSQGGTGQLSAFAVFNFLVGSASRIFTTIKEVDDKVILYGFVAGFVLNAVLAGQMVWYWNSSKTAGHGRELVDDKKVGKEGVLQKDGAALLTEGYSSGVKVTSSSGRRRG